MRRLVFAPSARDDLHDIARYLRDAAGDEIAADVVTRIRDKCDMLVRTPGELGTIRDEIKPGVRSFAVSPYVLFFRYTESTVEIARILHARQDVERKFNGD